MKVLKTISRIFVGLVFIFSGFVKAVDPLGTVYKFGDYFDAFGLSFLSPLSLFLAVGLCSIEFLAGISLLFNLKSKLGAWTVLAMMTVFTPLTLVLALTNPVSDCGCFGDAVHLTNWQTFFKNVILLLPSLFLVFKRKELVTPIKPIVEWTVLSAITAMFVLFNFYNLRYLPVIDFLPYKNGTHIPDEMVVPEGMPVDQYETTFIYEKDGSKKEFTLENYPANDTTWKFVDSKSALTSKGYEPPIHDLIFSTVDGDDKTLEVLSSENYTMFLISKKISEADSAEIAAGLSLGVELKNLGIDFYLLTSSSADDVYRFLEPHETVGFQDYETKEDFFMVDETTLKTMVRANPGYMLIKGGTIIDKWSWANKPDTETINNIINN